jgi:hypothetical protein
MKMNDMFPSKYLTSQDILDMDEEPTFRIKKVVFETLKNQEGQEEEKPILYFVEAEKGIVLNRTNASTIVQMFGDDTDAWKGKPITLGTDMVTAFGATKPAIRVRLRKANKPAPAAKQEPDDDGETPAYITRKDREDLALLAAECEIDADEVTGILNAMGIAKSTMIRLDQIDSVRKAFIAQAPAGTLTSDPIPTK